MAEKDDSLVLDDVKPQVSAPSTKPVVPGRLTVVTDGGCTPGRTLIGTVWIGMLICGISGRQGG